GNGSFDEQHLPSQVHGRDGIGMLGGIREVAASQSNYAFALKTDGTLLAWGSNLWGQLGLDLPGSSDQPLPKKVTFPGDLAVKAVAAAHIHPIALTADQTVWSWGFNGDGQVGNGSFGGNPKSPGRVQVRLADDSLADLTGVKAIAGGAGHGLALKEDGTVMAWGANNHGQLGDGTLDDRNTAAPVGGAQTPLTGVKAIAAGWHYSLALKEDGSVVAWGANNHGQLGDESTTQALVPVAVHGLTGLVIKSLASAFESSFALTEDGRVMAWGFNSQGQLGDGKTITRGLPQLVVGLDGTGALSGVAAIAAGDRHGLALKDDGTVMAWGLNSHGQLGDDSTTTHSTPVMVDLPSVSIRKHCGGSSEILETIPTAPGCVSFSAATILAGASYATVNGVATYTLYEGPDCTGGKRQASSDTYFCGTYYDNGHELNDQAQSISFP
ncbi:MAG: hypothetical protein ABI193_10060, partial [Minicystis sp.]